MDNGAFAHITDRCDYFSKFEDVDNTNVVLGNNQGLSVRGRRPIRVLLDTRQWYHDTCIDAGEMSLTVSSEYG
uniref:Retrovirus-related Pol polyprotein from transposon TNT 1-94-like beta-barrel domain-containing protein n=1 Tax=Timema shepardi TaxID=629360 RepID=A0A7R9G1M5_TIMSH|nr:unnamed protein product [Timema shepardi]